MNIPPTVAPPQQFLGFLVPGGPVRTDFVATDASKLTLRLSAPGDLPMPLSTVAQVVCFILPNAPIPPTHGLLIYWQIVLPDGVATGFELLGSLTPTNPSGVFRTNWSQHDQINNLQGTDCAQVVVGVSMEPLSEITNTVGTPYDGRLFVAQKIATDLFHFMQSFDTGGSGANHLVVPTNVFDRWMKRFEARFRRDPNFFMKSQD